MTCRAQARHHRRRSVGKELAEQFQAQFDCEVREGCRMTEASPMTFLTPPGRAVLGSTGVLMPNTEARVVDVDSGEDLEPGQRGEIWIRGPQLMKGYLNRPDATAETLTEDGWLKTGDIGLC
ncbi:MAG: AMP-binding protein [Thermomicrobiales bacterium]